jgi:hypothetical protein
MGKSKTPHKKFALRPISRKPYAPRPDQPEPTASTRRGYWPGSSYSDLEREWLRAVESLQKKERRKFLSHVDYLRLGILLGLITPPPPPTPREDGE